MTTPPPHAILLWTDDVRLYAELPMTTGGFHRLDFSLCEAGLARALNLLRQRAAPTPTRAKAAVPTRDPRFTNAQRIAAEAIVKGMK